MAGSPASNSALGCRTRPGCRTRTGTGTAIAGKWAVRSRSGRPGRVERVADEHQGQGGEAVGRRPSSRSGLPWTGPRATRRAGWRVPGAGDQRRGLGPDGVEQDRLAVGRPAAGQAVGEVHARRPWRRARWRRRRWRPARTGCGRRPRRERAAAPTRPGSIGRPRPTPPGRRCCLPTERSTRLASVRSRIRRPASSADPPWSGWASRTSSRKRRLISLRDGSHPGGEAEHTPAPIPRPRRPSARRRLAERKASSASPGAALPARGPAEEAEHRRPRLDRDRRPAA